MFNSRSLLFVAIVLSLAAAINFVLTTEAPEATATTEANPNDPDLYMRNATITQFTPSGTRQHLIQAELFTHFPLTDITTLRSPDMTLFPTAKKANPWDIVAEHGRLLPNAGFREEIIELWEDVLAVQTDLDGNFINIRTESLTVHPDTDYAETDQRVTIDDNSGRTTAAGMKAYFEEGKFLFFSREDERVQTILLPEFHNSPD